MDLTKFVHGAPGDLVDIVGTDPRTGTEYRHKAYVPHPLPKELSFTRETTNAIAETMLALGRLDQAAEWVPEVSLLARPAIRREAVSTSALEGTYAAFDDVLAADVQEQGRVTPEVREVLNYVRAAEAAFEWIRERHITVSFLAELQRTLVQDTPSDNAEAGRIRSSQVLIGPKGCKVTDARFVPPPPGLVLDSGVRDWEDWTNGVDDFPIVAKVAMGHYQFETLHPFTDGNGRIGRLIVLLELLRSEVLHHPLLNVSPTLHRQRDDYQDHLLRVSRTGDFDTWIQFFCRSLAEESTAAADRIRRLMQYRAEMRDQLRTNRVKGVAVDIAEELLSHPVVTPMWAKERHGVTYPAANAAIKRLESIGILEEITGGNYGRVFMAPHIYEIIR